MRQREGQEMRLVRLVVLSGAAGREELGFSSQHDGQRGVLAEHTVLGVECAGDACSLPLRGRWRGGGAGTTRAKGLSPAAPAAPAQRRRPGGWKTALRAHLGNSCRARARVGHVAQAGPPRSLQGQDSWEGQWGMCRTCTQIRKELPCSVDMHAV